MRREEGKATSVVLVDESLSPEKPRAVLVPLGMIPSLDLARYSAMKVKKSHDGQVVDSVIWGSKIIPLR